MGKVMLTIRLGTHEANLSHVKERFKLADRDVDEAFGLVSIDPEAHLYAILVEESAAEAASSHDLVDGPFSNPKIETFGPAMKRSED